MKKLALILTVAMCGACGEDNEETNCESYCDAACNRAAFCLGTPLTNEDVKECADQCNIGVGQAVKGGVVTKDEAQANCAESEEAISGMTCEEFLIAFDL